MMTMTVRDLAAATAATESNAAKYHPHILAAMNRFDIETPSRVAAFLANVSIETARLTKMEEDLYYRDAARLVMIYPRAFSTAADAQPYTHNSAALDRLLYQGYRGRGMLMLTHKRNYEAASRALGWDYVQNPGLVAEPMHAALTGAWFFADTGCNELADKGDINTVRRRINGPARLHVQEVAQLFVASQRWMETLA